MTSRYETSLMIWLRLSLDLQNPKNWSCGDTQRGEVTNQQGFA